VHRAVKEAYLERLAALAAKVRIGHGLAAGTTMGPLIRAHQRARVEAC
jgi:acyl-CoA reductase-like NAD-dependent aldehyde dehydrogenase